MLAKQIQALVLGSPSAAFAPGIRSGKAPFQQAKEWERAIGNRHPRPNLGHQPPSQITKKQNPTGTLEFVLHFEADSYHLSFCPRSWKIKRKLVPLLQIFYWRIRPPFSFLITNLPPFNIVYYFRREVVSFNMKNLHSDR